MFQTGEKVVYPLHGIGVVEEINYNQEKMYYLIRISVGDVLIRIPVEKAESYGLRAPWAKSRIEEMLSLEENKKVISSDNWNLRYKQNWERLRSGDLLEVLSVVKALQTQDKKKKLSLIENRLYSMARQILLSELAFSLKINTEMASELLANWLKN